MHFLILLFSLLLDFLSFLYILTKFYRVLCFTKIVFDQLILFNPYYWPLSTLRISTKAYFAFWRKILPPGKVGRTGFDVSSIIAFEFLSVILSLISNCKHLIEMEVEHLLSLSN